MPARRRRRRSRAARGPLPRSALPRNFFRRRSTLWLIAAIATLAVGIILGAIASTQGDEDGDAPVATATASAPPEQATGLDVPDLAPDEQRLVGASVVNVIDGDTIDVLLAGETERVRYFGIDTPERGDACYREATERNEELVADGVLLLPDPSPEGRDRDRSGRLLRYAFTQDGESVEARLIAEGLGVAWPDDGAYRDELLALEAEARMAGVGCLWGSS